MNNKLKGKIKRKEFDDIRQMYLKNKISLEECIRSSIEAGVAYVEYGGKIIYETNIRRWQLDHRYSRHYSSHLRL